MGKHEMLENYLWVVSVGIGDDRKWGRGGAVSGGRASRSCDQSGGAKQVRPSALRRGTRRRPAACSSMPAAAWLGNERWNDVNAMERGEHDHQ